jgi:AcrR family transcriptional regulator
VLETASHRAPGRPRCEVTHRAVLKAAYELLAEDGIGRFTIERVAARSGVARTTIYRWWPTKGALAMEGFLTAIAAEISVTPTDSVAADMRLVARLFARLLRGTGGRITRGIIAEGQSDPETMNAFVAGFVEPRRAAARAILRRGIESGELRSDLDIDLAISGLFGPLCMRMLLNEGLDDSWVDRLVDSVILRSLAVPERVAEPVGG